MKSLRPLTTMLTLVFAVTCFQVSVFGQSIEDQSKLAAMNASGLSVRWNLAAPSGGTLTISSPDGRTFRKEFKAGDSPEFTLVDQGERLPDGQYTYELRVNPAVTTLTKKSLAAARGKDDDAEAVRSSRKRTEAASQSLVQSGGFSIVNGAAVVAGATEGSRTGVVAPPAKVIERPRPSEATGAAISKIRQHHMAFSVMPDQVIPDDLIVQGSACVGLDCVNGEVFGFDTIRLKENNTRLQFDDTSASAGFPTNNWQIRANSSASGGGSFLGFVDQGTTGNSETGTIVLQVDAGAPANSLRVSSTGKVGIRTATPTLDVHMNTSDTPAIRFEQNNSGGFTAQTWDIGANEANFFVRDVTGGSRLPFRIRPGAPTSSVDISANGSVGVGTASPGFALDVQQNTFNNSTGTVLRLKGNITGTNNNTQIRFTGKTNGDLFTIGTDITTNNGTRNFQIFDLVGGAARATIDSSGNVGIGTAAPTALLSVNGTANKPGGGSWDVFSDERLKNITGQFNSGLKALMKLQPVRYEYKHDNALGIKSEGEHVGFGAQAVRNVIPEAVTTSQSGYLMVNNDPIILTMLNAIKEQQHEIEQLKAQVRKLKAAPRRRR